MSTNRILAAALAIGALAVPAAQAQPTDNAPVARTAAASARVHDLRHLRAGAANIDRAPDANVGSYTPGATPAVSYRAVHPTTRGRLPGPPTWPVNPQPIAPVHAVKAPDSSEVNPTTIGLGIAATLLALTGLVAFTRRSRHGRTRVTA